MTGPEGKTPTRTDVERERSFLDAVSLIVAYAWGKVEADYDEQSAQHGAESQRDHIFLHLVTARAYLELKASGRAVNAPREWVIDVEVTDLSEDGDETSEMYAFGPYAYGEAVENLPKALRWGRQKGYSQERGEIRTTISVMAAGEKLRSLEEG